MSRYRADRRLGGNPGRGGRAFTLLELAIAASLFLLAAGILSLAVANAIGSRAETAARRSVSTTIGQYADTLANGDYSALLANTFTPPSSCNGRTGAGTASQSCIVVGNQTFKASWDISYGAATALNTDAVAGATTISVATTSGINSGQAITIDLGANQENAIVSSVGTDGHTLTLSSGLLHSHQNAVIVAPAGSSSFGTSTVTTSAVTAGATSIAVGSISGISPNVIISVDTGSGQENALVSAVGADGHTLTLASGLANAHAAGTVVALGASGDPIGTSTNTASSLTITGSVTLADGTVISASRIANAPSYAYAPGKGVVRVQVVDSSSGWNGYSSLPVYLLQKNNPSVVVATGNTVAGVAVLRGDASACTSANPCVLGLSAGNSYGISGSLAELPSQVWGDGANIVLTAGSLTEGSLVVSDISNSTLKLSATNTATGQTLTSAPIGSVCLYANFNDGVSQQSVPTCNFSSAGSVALSDYAPDPARPNVRTAIPVGVPITLTTDSANGDCPAVANPNPSGSPTQQQGYTASGWTNSNVCTSWTWGNPSGYTPSGGSLGPWTGTSVTLSAGSSTLGTVGWSGTGKAADTFVTTGTTVDDIAPNGSVTNFITSGVSISSPRGLTLDATGNVYVTDTVGNKVVKITPAGVASTVTVSGITLSSPRGVAVDSSGNLFVADSNNRIVKITSSGVGSVLAGGTTGYADGTGAAAKFSDPEDLALMPDGSLVVADLGNGKIRKVTMSGVVSTTDTSSISGFGPAGVAVSPSGTVYVADSANNAIDTISGTAVSVLSSGYTNPTRVALDSSGNVFVTDTAGVYKIVGSGHSLVASLSSPQGIDIGSGWLSAQPAIGFGAAPVWSEPRVVQGCSATSSCTTLGTQVPENTTCPSTACYALPAPRLTSPMVGGQFSVLVSGTAPATTNFSLTATDDAGLPVTANVTAAPASSVGTLYNAASGGGTACGTPPCVVGTTAAGGGSLAMSWREASSSISLADFTVQLSDGVNSSTYTIALYRSTAYVASVVPGSVTIPQGGSGTLATQAFNADGSAASGGGAEAVLFSSSTTGVTVPGSAVSTSAGAASVTVTVANTVPAGIYSIRVSTPSGGATPAVTASAQLVVTQVLNTSGGVTSAITPTTSPNQGTTSTIYTVTAKDGAGVLMGGAAFSLEVHQAYSKLTVASVVGATTLTVAPIIGANPPAPAVGSAIMVGVGSIIDTDVVTAVSPDNLTITLATPLLYAHGIGATVMQSGIAAGVYPIGGSGGACVTDSSGTCAFTIQVDSHAAAGTYTLKLRAVNALGAIFGSDATLTVKATPATITTNDVTVQQGSSATETVGVLDGTGQVMGSRVVEFTSTQAGLSVGNSTATSSTTGQATATVSATSAVPAGSYTITAYDSIVTGATATFTVTVNSVPAAYTMSPGSLVIYQGGSQDVVFHIVNGAGAPVINTPVVFGIATSCTNGTVTYNPCNSYFSSISSGVTNSNGDVPDTISVAANARTGTYNIVTVSAGSPGVNLTATAIPVQVVAGVGSIVVGGTVAQASAGGKAGAVTTPLTLTVNDGDGNVYPGVTVSNVVPSSPWPSTGVLVSGSGTTDSSGQVPINVVQNSTGTPGVYAFTATITTSNGASVVVPCTFQITATIANIFPSTARGFSPLGSGGTLSAPRGSDLVLYVRQTDLSGASAIGVAPSPSASVAAEVGPVTVSDSTGYSIVTFHVPATAGNTTIALSSSYSGSVTWTATLTAT